MLRANLATLRLLARLPEIEALRPVSAVLALKATRVQSRADLNVVGGLVRAQRVSAELLLGRVAHLRGETLCSCDQ